MFVFHSSYLKRVKTSFNVKIFVPICVASDPVNNCHFGKYGALVQFSLTEKNENYKVEF